MTCKACEERREALKRAREATQRGELKIAKSEVLSVAVSTYADARSALLKQFSDMRNILK